jgi:hypothetical protein
MAGVMILMMDGLLAEKPPSCKNPAGSMQLHIRFFNRKAAKVTKERKEVGKSK